MKVKPIENNSEENANVWQKLKKNCSTIGPDVERKIFEQSFMETLIEAPGGSELLKNYGKKIIKNSSQND